MLVFCQHIVLYSSKSQLQHSFIKVNISAVNRKNGFIVAPVLLYTRLNARELPLFIININIFDECNPTTTIYSDISAFPQKYRGVW